MSIGLKGNVDGSGAVQVGGSDAITIDTSLNVAAVGTLKASGLTTAIYPVTASTTVAATSGTSVDFTNVPSWVRRITVMLANVSLTTTASTICVRIGSGSFEATGYSGGFGLTNTASAANATASTTTIPLANLTNAADTVSGAIILSHMGSNLWVASGTFFRSSGTTSAASMTASSKTTSGTLDRVQVVLDSTGAFDGAGSINILYE